MTAPDAPRPADDILPGGGMFPFRDTGRNVMARPAANVTDVLADVVLDHLGFPAPNDPEHLICRCDGIEREADQHGAHVAAILEAGPVAEAERRGAEAVLRAVDSTAQTHLAGGCHHHHQQGETEECNACCAHDLVAAACSAAEQTGSDQ